MDNIKLSIFRYCQPTPFLGLSSNGLYKRMRWNVECMKETEAREKVEMCDNRTEVTQEIGEQEAMREKRVEGDSTE